MQVQRFELPKNILCLVNTANLAHLFLVWPRFLPFSTYPAQINAMLQMLRANVSETSAQLWKAGHISTVMMGLNFVLLFFLLFASNKWQLYFLIMFSWALRHFLLFLMAEFSKTYIKLSGPCNNSLGLHSCFQGGPARRGEGGYFRKAAVFCISNIKLSHGISIALTNYFDKKPAGFADVFLGFQQRKMCKIYTHSSML